MAMAEVEGGRGGRGRGGVEKRERERKRGRGSTLQEEREGRMKGQRGTDIIYTTNTITIIVVIIRDNQTQIGQIFETLESPQYNTSNTISTGSSPGQGRARATQNNCPLDTHFPRKGQQNSPSSLETPKTREGCVCETRVARGPESESTQLLGFAPMYRRGSRSALTIKGKRKG